MPDPYLPCSSLSLSRSVNPLEKLQLAILRVTMQQYEQYHYDKEMLRKLANRLGQIEIESQCDLEHVRNLLNTKFEESITYPKVSQDWCFIDCKSWLGNVPCLSIAMNSKLDYLLLLLSTPLHN